MGFEGISLQVWLKRDHYISIQLLKVRNYWMSSNKKESLLIISAHLRTNL